MKRGIITLALLLGGYGVGLNHASAQFGTLGQPPARPRPTVSPYIDLEAGGAMGYYGLIRPQTDQARALQQLQQNLNLLNPDGSLKGQLDANKTASTTGLQTGHPTTFFNTGHYYPMPAGGTPSLGGSAGFGTGVGTGLGGYNPVLGVGGFGVGGAGVQTFFGSTLNQGFRP